MRTLAKKASAFIALSLALVATACGSSEGDTSTRQTVITSASAAVITSAPTTSSAAPTSASRPVQDHEFYDIGYKPSPTVANEWIYPSATDAAVLIVQDGYIVAARVSDNPATPDDESYRCELQLDGYYLSPAMATIMFSSTSKTMVEAGKIGPSEYWMQNVKVGKIRCHDVA